MDNKQWFKDAGCGMMVHWGLYSVIGGEWKGQRTPYYGEWAQSYFRIPVKEYEQIAKAFNPILFDAEQWVRLAKECGMQYFVMTAKHHDGFAMYRSRVDKFNIADATPFGRDVVSELAEACYKHNIKFGLYYSQAIDWHDPNGGGYNEINVPRCGTSVDNSWDFPCRDKKNYSVCFKEKILPQVTELLTLYGDLCLMWFDIPTTINMQQSKTLYELVKHYQPNCLVNSRIGNNMGDYTSTGDNEIPDDCKKTLYESACTLNDTWGYKPFDENWKSAKKIMQTRSHLNERNINYLINVGPDYLGRITKPAFDILKSFAENELI